MEKFKYFIFFLYVLSLFFKHIASYSFSTLFCNRAAGWLLRWLCSLKGWWIWWTKPDLTLLSVFPLNRELFHLLWFVHELLTSLYFCETPCFYFKKNSIFFVRFYIHLMISGALSIQSTILPKHVQSFIVTFYVLCSYLSCFLCSTQKDSFTVHWELTIKEFNKCMKNAHQCMHYAFIQFCIFQQQLKYKLNSKHKLTMINRQNN